jgi:hypothetical protein
MTVDKPSVNDQRSNQFTQLSIHNYMALHNLEAVHFAVAAVVSAQIVPGLLVLAIGYLGCNITLVLIAWFFAVTLITASYAGAMANVVDIAPNLAGKERCFE